MSIRYVIYEELRLVITVAEGRVTFAEVTVHQSRLLDDPAFDPTFNQLTDFTTTELFDVSVEEAKQISQRKIFSPGTKRAAVAKSPHIFGMYRMMQVYHHMAHPDVNAQVFSNRDEALEWLGIPEDSGLY